MKRIYTLLSLVIFTFIVGCTNDANEVNLDGITTPKDVSVLTTVTQDNTGKVTFSPKGEGVTQYEIYFGDDTTTPAVVNPGGNFTHTYKEGVYQSKIVGTTLNGKKMETTHEVVVSFRAPENLVVTIENDLAVSRKVTVKATADFALFYNVYFGEAGKPDPISANNGASVSYVYQQAGSYTIRVVSKSAAIKTTEQSKIVTVTNIVVPTSAAPMPPNRQAGDVISIYGSKYANVAGTNYFPDWGQGGQGSSWAEFDLNDDKMLNYIKLSYQGIALADNTTINVSVMEFFHMDVWTADATKIETSLISKSNGEKPVLSNLTANNWTSIDIPISAFTSQGLTVADIFQLKFVGTPWAAGTVFIDNIYFYKTPSQLIKFPIDFESSSLTYTWTGFGSSSFGPIPASVINNPNKTGLNLSSKVLEITKSAGAQVWAGASMNLDSSPNFTSGTKVKINVWSPKVGAAILFKMEVSSSPKDVNGNPTVFVEVPATTTVQGAWETLTFDLTSSTSFSTANLYDRVIVFPDFGTAGTGATYYFDDFTQF
jgi:hypothetical protein